MNRKYNNIDDFLLKTNCIPVLPENLEKINRMINNENINIEQISKLIASDPSLAAKVLKIANSVYYGRINKVVSINEALVVIGLNNVRSMLLAIFIEQFYNSDIPTDLNLLRELWKHSITIAMLSSKIIENYSFEEKEMAYTSGLLHDIGELLIYKYEPEIYKMILEELKNDITLNRLVIEELYLGFTHTDLGAVLANKWNLLAIKDPIFFHHYDYKDLEKKSIVLPIIIFSEILSLYVDLGGSDNYLKNKNITLDNKIKEILNLDEDKISYWLEEAKKIKEISDDLANFL